MTFKDFMVQVDILCTEKFGVDSRDLPDYCWFQDWGYKVPPKESIEDFLEYHPDYTMY